MATHDVTFAVPRRPIGKSNVEVDVRSNGTQLGRLLISKGALVWYPGSGKMGFKVHWSKFDQLIKESGSKGYYK
jgi:hypothetical protein